MGRTCEGCGATPEGSVFALHNYCDICGGNFCAGCMATRRCSDADDGKHTPHEERDDG